MNQGLMERGDGSTAEQQGSITPAVNAQELLGARNEVATPVVTHQPEAAPEFDLEAAEAQFNAEKTQEAAELRRQADELEAGLPDGGDERWQVQEKIKGLREQAEKNENIVRTGNASGDFLDTQDKLYKEVNESRDAYLRLRDGGHVKPAELEAARQKYEQVIFADITNEYQHQVDLQAEPTAIEASLQKGREFTERTEAHQDARMLMAELVRYDRLLAQRSVEMGEEKKGGRLLTKLAHNRLLRYAITASVVVGSAMTAAGGLPMLPEIAVKGAELLAGTFMSAGSYLMGRERVANFMKSRDQKAATAAEAAQHQELVGNATEAGRYIQFLRQEADPRVVEDVETRGDTAFDMSQAEREATYRTREADEPAIMALMQRYPNEILGEGGIMTRMQQSGELPADAVQLLLHDQVIRAEAGVKRDRHINRVKNVIGGLAGVATMAAFSKLSFDRIDDPTQESRA